MLFIRLDGAVPGGDFRCLFLLLIEPVGGDRLALCVEAISVLTQAMQVAEEGLFVPAEGDKADRYRNTLVDADLAAGGTAGKLPGILAALGVDHGAVGIGIGVHNGQALLKVLAPFDA